MPSCGTLTPRERALLDYERGRVPRADGSHEQAVLDLFDLPITRYLQLLNALLDRPEALAYAPSLVLRLQRIRTRGKRPWISSTSTAPALQSLA